MSLAEVLPEVQSLTPNEKLRLFQYLAHDIDQDQNELIVAGRSYPIWSPDCAFTAAEALLQVLAEDRSQV